MRQATMIKPGEIIFNDIAEPQITNDNQVKLKIQRIGVCGSDMHVYHGKHPFTPYPVVQGHEYSGVVVETGNAVQKVKPGDKVTARPQQVCGKCPPCLRGDYNICNNLKVEGFQAPGTAQDFYIVPEDRVVRLPDSFTMEQGALVEPCAVGAHCTNKAGELDSTNVVVLGAGPIGNLTAQFARARGAAKVLIRDISEFRLEKAQKCDIEYVSNAKNESMESACQRVFGGKGFDVIFECAGVEQTLDQAIQHVNKGGRIVAVAVYDSKPKVDMSILGDRELKLIGTLMYKHEDYEEAISFISDGKIITDPLLTGHFPFEKYLEAYQFIDKQGDQTLKVMIDL